MLGRTPQSRSSAGWHVTGLGLRLSEKEKYIRVTIKR
jgi:hypothetical protein